MGTLQSEFILPNSDFQLFQKHFVLFKELQVTWDRYQLTWQVLVDVRLWDYRVSQHGAANQRWAAEVKSVPTRWSPRVSVVRTSEHYVTKFALHKAPRFIA